MISDDQDHGPVSVSGHSMGHPISFRERLPESSLTPNEGFSVSQLDSIFKDLLELLMAFVTQQLQRFHAALASDYPECLARGGGEEEQSSGEAILNITLHFLKSMNQEELAHCLQTKSNSAVCQRKLKLHLQQKFCVCEGVAKAGNPAPLNQIYTELYMIEGGASEVNQEHEVRHRESASKRAAAPETTITCDDVFKASPHRQRPIRTVLTKGVAGVGKTVLTQKFSLDWAEGRAHQELQLLFPFTFRELNVLRDKFSLVELLHHFFSPSKDLCSFQQLQVLFIFDGLDECRLPLDFSRTRVLIDPTESVSVDVLLVNLIRGSLLPSARLWITTRPAAANQIPAECVSMVTEVQGFSDPQKEQYFRKSFREKKQAEAVISHIKANRSLDIMCYIPVFCWISASVLDYLIRSGSTDQLPHTLTQMYVHFLVVQAKVKNIKYHERSGADPHWTPETREMVRALGKLAFEQLQKGNLIFNESDLSTCGLNAIEAARYSGVFTQVFREEPGLYQDKVYCFIHLSVQEFLAALHVHQTFVENGINLLSEKPSTLRKPKVFKTSPNLKLLHQTAVDQALRSPNGHLDLFLRFLLGLSLPTNQNLLQGLLTQTENNSNLQHKSVRYILKKINEDFQAERCLNLFHCLKEVNDDSSMEQIQNSLTSGQLSEGQRLSPAQWSALAFLLLSSKDKEDFSLANNTALSETGLRRLLPVIKASTTTNFSGCDLSWSSSLALLSALGSSSSSLRQLILDHNPLRDSGLELLCSGLKSPNCKLEALSLRVCNLSEGSCSAFATVLKSESRMRLLDLSNNNLRDLGVKQLSEGLKNGATCRLEVLRLSGCMISASGAALIAAALSVSSSCLRELDLSYNHPGSSAMQRLTALCEDPRSSLDSLRLEPAGLIWLTPGLRKYFCALTLDPNSRRLFGPSLSLYGPPLSGRCYWEVDWRLVASNRRLQFAVSSRRGLEREPVFGLSDQSWCLQVSAAGYAVRHNNAQSRVHSFGAVSGYPVCGTVAVFLDCPAGSLTFYEVCAKGLIHIYSFNATFTERLFAGFALLSSESLLPPGGSNNA